MKYVSYEAIYNMEIYVENSSFLSGLWYFMQSFYFLWKHIFQVMVKITEETKVCVVIFSLGPCASPPPPPAILTTFLKHSALSTSQLEISVNVPFFFTFISFLLFLSFFFWFFSFFPSAFSSFLLYLCLLLPFYFFFPLSSSLPPCFNLFWPFLCLLTEHNNYHIFISDIFVTCIKYLMHFYLHSKSDILILFPVSSLEKWGSEIINNRPRLC